MSTSTAPQRSSAEPVVDRPVRTVLLAPDKFKGSLPASGVVAALESGLRRADPDLVVRSVPVADGGDGTLDAAVAAGFERVAVEVAGPTDERVRTAWARRRSGGGAARPGRADDADGAMVEAVVEMADACGLVRLGSGLAPLTASSRGLGEVVRAALDGGADRVVVGIGGSASTDGGAGFLSALGARLLDGSGFEVGDGGAALAGVVSVDLSGLHPRLGQVVLEVACDVDNPLLGPHGAAAVYGPQKGASPDDVARLDAALGRWADVVAAAVGADHREAPGAGAAGGVGFAALALGAQLRPGIELVLDLVGFDAVVAGADLVVVGEGSLDAQSLHGKAPVGVASAARAAGARVVAVCGRRDVTDADLAAAGIAAVHALTDVEPDPAVCIRDAARLLEQVAPRLLG